MLIIRPEEPDDIPAIEELLITAFAFDSHSVQNEHHIVNRLREEGVLALCRVADSTVEGLVGVIAFSPVTISDGTPDWYALGPVAVEPRFQRRGVGRQLMETGLRDLREYGAAGCVVVGDPEFHERFGFGKPEDLTLPGAYPAFFMSQRFHGPAPAGAVVYHSAFQRGPSMG